MKKISFIIMAMFALVLTACQDKDIEREAMKLSAPDASQITGTLSGDDYIWTWPAQNAQMQVSVYRYGTLSSNEIVSGNSFTQKDVPTNVPFEYVFKLTDGTNFSSGVIKNSPAEAAELMEGDIISKVDGEDMAGLELDEVVSHIRGPEGTKVTLTLIRNGETLEVELTRAQVNTPTVESEMKEDGIGYLQITEFDDVTVDQFTENFNSLKEQGMKGLIIDLRGNPGGSVDTVCAVAKQLLPQGMIFYMEDKDGKRTEYTCDGADFDLPLVVLVNEYSASASEILSGAIKDAGIGKLVGKKTYGKGIVQSVIGLGDGSAVKLTIANYYTRNGNDIHLKGIEPDVEVELDSDAYLEDKTDTQLDKAIEVLKEEMK